MISSLIYYTVFTDCYYAAIESNNYHQFNSRLKLIEKLN